MDTSDSDRKLGELFLYVARKTEGDDSYSLTKLYKTLFYADFEAYAKHGESISGAVYHRLTHGPAPRRALPVIGQLEERHDAAVAERDYFNYKQKKLYALREPHLEGVSGEQIAIVDDVIRRLWGVPASEVSRQSHRFTAWEAAREKEEIPYSTVMLAPSRAPTQAEIEYGQQLARELNG